jgi:hypothetical protein
MAELGAKIMPIERYSSDIQAIFKNPPPGFFPQGKLGTPIGLICFCMSDSRFGIRFAESRHRSWGLSNHQMGEY